MQPSKRERLPTPPARTYLIPPPFDYLNHGPDRHAVWIEDRKEKKRGEEPAPDLTLTTRSDLPPHHHHGTSPHGFTPRPLPP